MEGVGSPYWSQVPGLVLHLLTPPSGVALPQEPAWVLGFGHQIVERRQDWIFYPPLGGDEPVSPSALEQGQLQRQQVDRPRVIQVWKQWSRGVLS